MSEIQNLITDNLDIWTSAIKNKKTVGRGSSKKLELTGIKKLRELILELAVRGKLVPQDPDDEPASVLLEKIAVEKERLYQEKQIKKQKPLPEISEDEKPFELPIGWEWAKLGNLSSDIHYGYTASAIPENKAIRLLRITDIQNDKVNWETVPGCEITQSKSNNYLLRNNDVLIARTGGTIGKSYLVENINVDAIFASYLIRVKRISAMNAPYIKTYLGSQLYWNQLYDNTSGTGQPNVNATALKSLMVAIAPINEQHRIVAKVDELMALCDQLEQQSEDSITAHQTLVDTLLDALVSPEQDASTFTRQPQRGAGFTDSWTLIEQNFELLFTTEQSIDKLKQTILQLAVMGKLVPQDPNDEPTSVLLEKIAAEKEKLIKDKKIKKQKVLPEIDEKKMPFNLPKGWKWNNLSDLLALVTDGDHQAPPKSDSGVPFLVIGNLNTGNVIFDNSRYVPEEYYKKLDWGRKPAQNDILYTVTGSYGIPISVDIKKDFCVQRHVAIFKVVNSTPKDYLELLLKAKYAFEYSTTLG